MEFRIRSKADLEGVKGYLDALKEGKEYTVNISPIAKRRSVSQNRLYHMWLNCISKETGNDADALHRYFARKYLGVEVKEVFGDKVSRVVSTTSLTTAQFTDYLDRIQAEMAEMGVILPQPSDIYYSAFQERYDTI